VVYVEISVDKYTPIREDSVATLEAQGLTGTSLVMISGGSSKGHLLTPSHDQPIPLIKSEAAGLQEILQTLPQVLNAANTTLRDIDTFFSASNRLAVEGILNGLNRIISSLSRRIDVVESTLVNIEASSRDLSTLLRDLQPVGKELASAMNKFEDTMSRIDTVSAAAAPGLEKFSRDGIDDFRRLMIDTRQMVNSINRLTQRIESDPRRFLFGQPMPEYSGQ
jgi:phospholipid/cholesterol/gamma-HCH transport system substrate-binding protein